MIALLRARAESRISAAVLMRDAVRLARRWQTYATRAAFSGILLSLVLTTIWAITNMTTQVFDPSQLGTAGRYMFVAFAVVQVLVASLVAPLIVAAAVIEEREQGTIELLLMTRLDARRILAAKILARMLLLLTVVLGGLPVMALVTTIGGASVVEVVAVTVHALVATVVLGVVAGFFAVFTRHAGVAAVASIVYGLLAFLFSPILYVTLTGDWHGLASFSPLYGGTARNWWALLPALTYLPIVWLTITLGARFYELKVSRARMLQFVLNKNWALPSLKWTAIAVGLAMLTVLPFAVGGSWFYTLGKAVSSSGSPMASGPMAVAWTGIGLLLGGGSRFFVWAWCVGALYLATWLYLRLVSEMVLMTDDMIDPRLDAWSGKGQEVAVWGNPVAWRSLRRAHWRTVFPAFLGWGVVMLVVFQLGLWIIPGGILAVGALNAVAAVVLALWLGASSIEVERRDGSFEILLTSTLGAFHIVVGKLIGIMLPSGVIMVFSIPLLAFGGPHLEMLFIDQGGNFGHAAIIALAGAAWAIGLWVLASIGSMVLALALPNPRSAYSISVVSLGMFLVAPPSILAFASETPVVAQVLRLLVPVLVSKPTLWEIGISLGVMLGIALALFVACCVKLRTWGLRHA